MSAGELTGPSLAGAAQEERHGVLPRGDVRREMTATPVVLYTQPGDAACFDEHYLGVPGPLVEDSRLGTVGECASGPHPTVASRRIRVGSLSRGCPAMSVFFVPGVPTGEAELVYARLRVSCGCQIPSTTERIREIRWTHDGDKWVATVEAETPRP